MDRHWNILRGNQASERLTSTFIDDPRSICGTAPLNALRLLCHPAGLRRFVENWEEVCRELIARLRREAARQEGGISARLLDEILGILNENERSSLPEPLEPRALFIPLVLSREDIHLSFVTTITTLGTAQDITLEELRIETYFSEDAATEHWIRMRAHPRNAAIVAATCAGSSRSARWPAPSMSSRRHSPLMPVRKRS